MTNPTHRPVLSIQSPGSQSMSLLQNHPPSRHQARNLWNREKVNRASATHLGWETLRVQHICSRRDDTAGWRVWLWCGSLVTGLTVISAPPQLLGQDSAESHKDFCSLKVVVVKTYLVYVFFFFFFKSMELFKFWYDVRVTRYLKVQNTIFCRCTAIHFFYLDKCGTVKDLFRSHSFCGQQNHVSLHWTNKAPPTWQKEGGWWSQPKIDPAWSSAPHTSHIVLCPAVPCSSVGWDDDRM